jgi:hypothetical protein
LRPDARIARGVQQAQRDGPLDLDDIENRKWEAGNDRATRFALDRRVNLQVQADTA